MIYRKKCLPKTSTCITFCLLSTHKQKESIKHSKYISYTILIRQIACVWNNPFIDSLSGLLNDQHFYHIIDISQYSMSLIEQETHWRKRAKNGRRPYLFHQKKFVRVLYAINIYIIYNFKPTNFNCA